MASKRLYADVVAGDNRSFRYCVALPRLWQQEWHGAQQQRLERELLEFITPFLSERLQLELQ